jgi:hypothetical protein
MCKRGSRRTAAIGAVVVLGASLGMTSCGDTAEPGDGQALSDLTIQVLEGYISANLQPMVPPDPILCTLTLRIVNTNAGASYSGLSVPSAEVFLGKDSRRLGTIRFQTDWDGSIGAGAIDTVVVTKIQEGAEIFEPPCGEQVYLRGKISKSAVQSRTFPTPSYRFSCPVNAANHEEDHR